MIAATASVNPTLFGGAKARSRDQYWNHTCWPALSAGATPLLIRALKSYWNEL
jgi:hypothetical protein